MKRPAVVGESIPYISKMAIGNAGMECRNSKKVPPSCPHLFRKGKNQYKLKKLQRNSGLQKIPTGQKWRETHVWRAPSYQVQKRP